VVSLMPIRAVTLDLWLTLVWSTKELDEYYRFRRRTNFYRLLKRRAEPTNSSRSVTFANVRLAIEEMKAKAEEAAEEGIELSLREKGRILFQSIGAGLASDEEEVMYERVGRILSNSGLSSKLPYLNPEAIPALNRLKKEFPELKIGVISNAGTSSQTYAQVFESLRIPKVFDSLTISCDVGFVKPSRKIFEHAANSLSVNPSEILHVGDDFQADIVGAVNSGMHAALYTGLWHRYASWQGAPSEKLPEGFRAKRGRSVKEISSLHEIPKLIEDSQ
jgi:FMN phosphatase YigB (HAD superfamily)